MKPVRSEVLHVMKINISQKALRRHLNTAAVTHSVWVFQRVCVCVCISLHPPPVGRV